MYPLQRGISSKEVSWVWDEIHLKFRLQFWKSRESGYPFITITSFMGQIDLFKKDSYSIGKQKKTSLESITQKM